MVGRRNEVNGKQLHSLHFTANRLTLDVMPAFKPSIAYTRCQTFFMRRLALLGNLRLTLNCVIVFWTWKISIFHRSFYKLIRSFIAFYIFFNMCPDPLDLSNLPRSKTSTWTINLKKIVRILSGRTREQYSDFSRTNTVSPITYAHTRESLNEVFRFFQFLNFFIAHYDVFNFIAWQRA